MLMCASCLFVCPSKATAKKKTGSVGLKVACRVRPKRNFGIWREPMRFWHPKDKLSSVSTNGPHVLITPTQWISRLGKSGTSEPECVLLNCSSPKCKSHSAFHERVLAGEPQSSQQSVFKQPNPFIVFLGGTLSFIAIHFIVLCTHCVFYKLKVCGNLALRVCGHHFSAAFAHFMSLCHTVVTLTIFQTFSFWCHGDLGSVVFDGTRTRPFTSRKITTHWRHRWGLAFLSNNLLCLFF